MKHIQVDRDSYEDAIEAEHGRNDVHLYVLDPDNTVREVFDIREWNNRPRRLYRGSSGHARSSTVHQSRTGGVDVLTMFAEMESEYERDNRKEPFSTFFTVRYELGDHRDERKLEKALRERFELQGYCTASTWSEAMSQHNGLLKQIRAALKAIKARERETRKPVSA